MDALHAAARGDDGGAGRQLGELVGVGGSYGGGGETVDEGGGSARPDRHLRRGR